MVIPSPPETVTISVQWTHVISITHDLVEAFLETGVGLNSESI